MKKDVEVLLSTVKMTSIKALNLKKKNITNNLIIVNQLMNKDEEYITDGIKVYDTREKGISKSRNRLIDMSTAEVCIMTDDDISFVKDYEEKIKEAYLNYPEADIITFNLKKGDQILGPKKDKKLNYLDLFRIFSVQISFKRAKVLAKGLRYDENFGIGSDIINIGEENIFLTDAYKKGLKIYHIAQVLIEHPDEDTTGEKWTVATTIDKGATAKRTLGFLSFTLLTYMVLTKRKYYNKEMGTFKFIKHYLAGGRKYLAIKKGRL